MKNKMFQLLNVLILSSITACTQETPSIKNVEETKSISSSETSDVIPHNYGGWYCPDNLTGFPAVNIADWKEVAVVNGRMPTKEETQNGTSLIHVDVNKYPNAKPLDMRLPKLAKVYNQSTDRVDLIIVIQAIHINNDSIVGYRFLNGGNGSARLNEVRFLTDDEINQIPTSKFVAIDLKIKASQDVVWEVMRNEENSNALAKTFDADNLLKTNWRKSTNLNYFYSNTGASTAKYANKLFGNFYIQNDYKQLSYSEKFLLLQDDNTKTTTLKILCGPFADDFENQQKVLKLWAQKIKELSEQGVSIFR